MTTTLRRVARCEEGSAPAGRRRAHRQRSSTTAAAPAAPTAAAASSSASGDDHRHPDHVCRGHALADRDQFGPTTAAPDRVDPIPFEPGRKAETAAYVRRHYGSVMRPTLRLIHPHVIVIHYIQVDLQHVRLRRARRRAVRTARNLRAFPHRHQRDDPPARVPGNRLPPHRRPQRTAIGIENVGFSHVQVLPDHRQITASLRLVRWLRCRYHIPIRDVIGHNEVLSSPYHHEEVAALRAQTHSDFNHTGMQTYRRRLRQEGGCA